MDIDEMIDNKSSNRKENLTNRNKNKPSNHSNTKKAGDSNNKLMQQNNLQCHYRIIPLHLLIL